MPDWLTELKNDLKEISLPLARKFWAGAGADGEPYFNYRYQHVEQVERDARRLFKAYGGDKDIVMASVWIHDRCQPQFAEDEHGKKAAEWAEKNLSKTGFPTAKVPAVVYAVANHSNPPQTIPETAKEARLLWDADKLGKVDPLAVVFTLGACPAFPKTRVDSGWVIQNLRETLKYGRLLPSSFYYPLSREIGGERYQALEAFVTALEKETGVD
jgi:hypothetical protein